MFKSLFLPIIAVFVFITLVGLLTQGKFDSFLKRPVQNSNLKEIVINNKKIYVEVARTSSERSKGLSNRDSLEKDNGMIFIFIKDSKPVFWMKDTKIALDIVWINDNKIVGIEKNIEPELKKSDSELKKYAAPSVVDYVLEVNAGFTDGNSIKVGQTISGLLEL